MFPKHNIGIAPLFVKMTGAYRTLFVVREPEHS